MVRVGEKIGNLIGLADLGVAPGGWGQGGERQHQSEPPEPMIHDVRLSPARAESECGASSIIPAFIIPTRRRSVQGSGMRSARGAGRRGNLVGFGPAAVRFPFQNQVAGFDNAE